MKAYTKPELEKVVFSTEIVTTGEVGDEELGYNDPSLDEF